jgi:FkbM family methyltransferase
MIAQRGAKGIADERHPVAPEAAPDLPPGPAPGTGRRPAGGGFAAEAAMQAAAWLAWPLMRRMGRRGDRIVRDCGDHRIAFNPDDTIIAWRLLAAGQYQRPQFERALAVLAAAGRLKPDSVFLDIGANIGTHTLYALRSGRFRRAIAIEPEPANFDLLAWNVALNGLGGRVDCLRLAAGAAEGTAALSLDRFNKGGHSIASRRSAEAVQVEVRPVDAVLAGLGVAPADVGLVWIDVEGFEPEAVAGMASLTAAGIPLCLEFNRRRYGPDKTRAFVAALGRHYRHFAYMRWSRAEIRPVAELATGWRRDVVVF